MSRDNFISVASGMQGVGKTQESFDYTLFKAFAAPFKQKGLIIELNQGEYADKKDKKGVVHKIKQININEVIKYGSFTGYDVRRVTPVYPNGMPMAKDDLKAFVIRVMNEYRNGILILEDFNKSFRTLPDDIVATLINVRHRGVDPIAHIQSVGKLSPTLLENTKIVRYHYQLDSVIKSKNKLEGEEEIFLLAEALVKKKRREGNLWFFCYIDRVDKKITGAFSSKDFTLAIQSYLLANPSEVTPITRQVDMDGKKLYSYNECLNIKTVELYRTYFGNKVQPQFV